MITLKTGVPGASKTLSAVHELALLLGSFAKKESDFRPIYVHGVRDLALPHFDLPDATKWSDCPDGSLIVIDEAQGTFPPRSPSSKTPDHVAALNVHRHRGIDIWLITQHPKLLDQSVRRLVGKHQHYRRVFGGQRSICYEWDHCDDSLNSIRTAVKKIQAFPRDVFKYYKSAEVHTKQRFSVPSWLYLVPVAVIALVGYGGWRVSGIIAGKSAALAAIAPASSASVSGAVVGSIDSPPSAGVVAAPSAEPPRRIAGCIMIKARCECIDSAGVSTPVDYDMCRASSQRSGLLVAYDMAPTSSGPVSRPSSASSAPDALGTMPTGISTSYTPRNPVRDLSGTLGGIGTPSAAAHDLDGSILAGMRGTPR